MRRKREGDRDSKRKKKVDDGSWGHQQKHATAQDRQPRKKRTRPPFQTESRKAPDKGPEKQARFSEKKEEDNHGAGTLKEKKSQSAAGPEDGRTVTWRGQEAKALKCQQKLAE